MPDGTPKICIHCGQDCSGKPRIKDPQGRYACKACVDARAAQAAAKPAPKPAAPKPPALAPLLDEDDNPLYGVAEPEVAQLRQSPTQPCPSCGVLLPEGAVLCTSCGRSLTTGKAIGTRIGAPVDAKVYSDDPKKAKREREREKADAASTRNQYVVPIVMFVIGAGVTVGVGLSGTGATPEEASRFFGIMMAVLVGYSLASTIAYLICCALWMGLNAALHIVILQMLGIVSCTVAVEVLMASVGMGGIPSWVVGAMTCAGLMTKVMDLDFQDAILASVIAYRLPAIVVWFVLLPMLRG